MAALDPLWLDARTYYRRRWGEPLGRVGVDGGFSCPNRGPDRASKGCSFCSDTGNRAPYALSAVSIEDQIHAGIEFQRSRYGMTRFGLYFQSYSSTWAPVDQLRGLYDRGLASGPFSELTVGTRPDCVPEPVVELLAEYENPGREVWVELGLQSCRDETLIRVKRGHSVKSFDEAARRLSDARLKFTAHVMYGLPGETAKDFLSTVDHVVASGASGIKFHDLLIVPGTELFREWSSGRLAPVDPQEYVESVAQAITRLPSDLVVWRVCSDPENRQASERVPGEKWAKNVFLQRLRSLVVKQISG